LLYFFPEPTKVEYLGIAADFLKITLRTLAFMQDGNTTLPMRRDIFTPLLVLYLSLFAS
jgi:hypothetical protein